ncbi:MAG: hypothetical protein JRF63_11570 [Deltaproteobacteria bacterium]|nr:hypothetical protein [Deltaproteobacteria bacterium]
MKRFGVLLAGLTLVVSAAGCEIEGEAVAGTLDGREPAAVETPGVAPDEAARAVDAFAQGGCPFAKAKAAYGDVGCGGGCGGDKACGEVEDQVGCGGGCGGDAYGDGFGGGGCGDGAF